MITYWHLPCFMTRAELRDASVARGPASTGPSSQLVKLRNIRVTWSYNPPVGESVTATWTTNLGRNQMSNNKRARTVFAKKSSVVATEFALALIAAQIAYAQQPPEQAAPPQQPPGQAAPQQQPAAS